MVVETRRLLVVVGWIVAGILGGIVLASPAHAAEDSASRGEARSPDAWLRRAGEHIRLTTDLPSASEADALVTSFDAAVDQWAEFWQLPPGSLGNWQVEAFVMRDAEAFRRRGRIPDRLPDFPFGYAAGNTLWVHAQPSEYYTRHLLLHEGVHALAFEQFGGAGPTWYMEGTAELLALHRGVGRSLKINRLPQARDETPYWGRFRMIAERREAGAIPSLESVMRLPRDLKGDVEAYSWSWAATMLLEAYPEYREVFLAAARQGRDSSSDFTRQLYRRLQSQWAIVTARWRMMCHELDYGFDWSRERIELTTRDPVWDGEPLEMNVSAERGWQSLGVRLPAGTTVRLTPEGECTIAETTEPWISQPPGVTIRYHRGRPLGQLLACVLPIAERGHPQVHPLEITPVAETTELAIDEQSWLLLRINDAVDELEENRGGYGVRMAPVE